MRVTSLGSGSSGNAFLISSRATTVLVDAGVPFRTLRAALDLASVPNLSAVLVTHEHIDHVRALPRLARLSPAPWFATSGTASALSSDADTESHPWEILGAGSPRNIGDLEVTAFHVSHDAREPVGFLIDDGDARAIIVTDLGAGSDGLADVVAMAELVIFEANYDPVMLQRGPYPASLKQRISGPLGHLSNDDCAIFLAGAVTDRCRDIWLAHLSETNNRPGLAAAATEQRLREAGRRPAVRPLPRRATVSWDSDAARLRPRQARLPLG